MTIVSLLSHSCDLLSPQIACFRRMLPGVPFVVVQGPFGAKATTSGGSVKLRDEAEQILGIRVLTSPQTFAGLHFAQRISAILAWAREQVPGDVLIVHGDLFPTKTLGENDLFRGKPSAGRVYPNGRPTYTWLALRAGQPIPRMDKETNPRVFQPFSARRPVAGFDPSLGFEFCEPGFLHADKLSLSASGPVLSEMFARKLAAIHGMMDDVGVECPQVIAPCVSLGNLPRHAAQPVMLAGDIVESYAKRVGADRLARWWERLTGRACGCESRKHWLNRVSQKLRDRLHQ